MLSGALHGGLAAFPPPSPQGGSPLDPTQAPPPPPLQFRDESPSAVDKTGNAVARNSPDDDTGNLLNGGFVRRSIAAFNAGTLQCNGSDLFRGFAVDQNGFLQTSAPHPPPRPQSEPVGAGVVPTKRGAIPPAVPPKPSKVPSPVVPPKPKLQLPVLQPNSPATPLPVLKSNSAPTTKIEDDIPTNAALPDLPAPPVLPALSATPEPDPPVLPVPKALPASPETPAPPALPATPTAPLAAPPALPAIDILRDELGYSYIRPKRQQQRLPTATDKSEGSKDKVVREIRVNGESDATATTPVPETGGHVVLFDGEQLALPEEDGAGSGAGTPAGRRPPSIILEGVTPSTESSPSEDENLKHLRAELTDVITRAIDSVKTPTGSTSSLELSPSSSTQGVKLQQLDGVDEGEEDEVPELRSREGRTVLEASPGQCSRRSALDCEECAASPVTPLGPPPARGLKGLLMQCSCAAPLLSPHGRGANAPSTPPPPPPDSPPPTVTSSSSKWYVKPTWRLWGEERTPGAIHTVYLKKVRYHRPTRTAAAQDSDDEISHLEWETVRVRFVKAGTLEKLVESLATDDGELESTYINVFLATYRTFASADTVLTLLLDRYELLASSDQDPADMILEQHRKTLVLALHVWLDSYPEDFRDPPQHPALQQMLLFCKQHLPDSELEVKVRHRLEKFNRDDQLLDASHLYTGGPMCLSHNTLVNGGSPTKLPYSFPDVPEAHFAEQLTRMDMELFKKLVPHQCLGAVWSRRDKNRSQEAATVLATVNQFNAVSFRVISTVLMDPDLRPSERAKIIATWIDIAQELRVLKNFSSLKAIISGLQSNPVYRLQRTWQSVPRDKVELYDELARIFSEDNNQWAQRELLMREGTAKFADTVGHNDRQLQKVFQKQLNNSVNISHGTIPYLGTFLTDLTMIDTAIPDMVGDGMINFDKRRKEFEVLAQIKLLQGAANAYNIPHDPTFDRWFDSLLVLDDREAFQLSCQIEPPSNGTVNSGTGAVARDVRHRKRTGLGHRKNDSIASTSSSSSSQFYCDLDSLPSSPHNSLDRKASPSQMSSSSSSSSLRSLDVSVSSSNHSSTPARSAPQPQPPLTAQPPHLNAQLTPSAQLNNPPDFYIIRVTVEPDGPETEGVIMYKSIMLSNNERTPQVIRNAMLKLGLEGNPDHFSLSQVLPDRELLLPANANVYYAVNTQFNLNFILRNKKGKKEPEPVPPCRTKSSKKLLPAT